jgi:hypothetical protein
MQGEAGTGRCVRGEMGWDWGLDVKSTGEGGVYTFQKRYGRRDSIF